MIALHLADLGIPFTPLWPPELSERCAELSKRLADAASSIEGEARLDAARGFARYLGASDPAAEIPRHGLLAARPNRHHPYIFTGQEIAALLNEAGQHSWHLPAVTYPALFGLIAVTGCRLGEAVRLEDADVDLDETMITIRDSKYGKSRRIPVDATVTAALQDYLGRRRSLRPAPKAPTLFLSAYGTRLITRTTSPPRRSSPRWPTALLRLRVSAGPLWELTCH
jgi:integrase